MQRLRSRAKVVSDVLVDHGKRLVDTGRQFARSPRQFCASRKIMWVILLAVALAVAVFQIWSISRSDFTIVPTTFQNQEDITHRVNESHGKESRPSTGETLLVVEDVKPFRRGTRNFRNPPLFSSTTRIIAQGVLGATGLMSAVGVGVFCRRRYLNGVKELLPTTVEKPFECAICRQRFTQKGNLTVHERSHHEEKRYACQICKKKFHRRQNLTTHMRTHTKEKPYACSHTGCFKSFAQLSNFKRHERTHLGVKPYPCDQCAKRFADKRNLLAHAKKIHGIVLDEICSFRCPECDMGFKRAFDMEQHRREHSVYLPISAHDAAPPPPPPPPPQQNPSLAKKRSRNPTKNAWREQKPAAKQPRSLPTPPPTKVQHQNGVQSFREEIEPTDRAENKYLQLKPAAVKLEAHHMPHTSNNISADPSYNMLVDPSYNMSVNPSRNMSVDHSYNMSVDMEISEEDQKRLSFDPPPLRVSNSDPHLSRLNDIHESNDLVHNGASDLTQISVSLTPTESKQLMDNPFDQNSAAVDPELSGFPLSPMSHEIDPHEFRAHRSSMDYQNVAPSPRSFLTSADDPYVMFNENVNELSADPMAIQLQDNSSSLFSPSPDASTASFGQFKFEISSESPSTKLNSHEFSLEHKQNVSSGTDNYFEHKTPHSSSSGMNTDSLYSPVTDIFDIPLPHQIQNDGMSVSIDMETSTFGSQSNYLDASSGPDLTQTQTQGDLKFFKGVLHEENMQTAVV